MEASQALAALQQGNSLPPSALGLLVHLAAELTQLPLILKVLCNDGAMATWLDGCEMTRSTYSCDEWFWVGRAQQAQKNSQREALEGGLQGTVFLSHRVMIERRYLESTQSLTLYV